MNGKILARLIHSTIDCKNTVVVFLVVLLIGLPAITVAQLVECDLANQNQNTSAEGGCINKTLSDQVGEGSANVDTFASSTYIIKRDPARAIRRGRQLFQRKFSQTEGVGPRVNVTSSGDITQQRALGAGLTDSCAACHGRPRGAAGFGGDVNTRPDSRDAPHLFGLGIVEQLAEEMTQDLRTIQSNAIAEAKNGKDASTIILDSNFTNDNGGFVYADDVFNTTHPEYSHGEIRRGRALIRLGGRSKIKIVKISGGWQTHFKLENDSNIKFDFDYRLKHSSHHQDGSSVDAIFDINGQQTILATTSNRQGDSNTNTGTQSGSVTLLLKAGTHIMTLGAYYRQKSVRNNYAIVSYDNVVVTNLNDGSTSPGAVTAELNTKGVNFGSITAFPDGSVDVSAVEGVNDNLRLLPFFHHGGTASIREFIVGAFKDEMGLQAVDPILCTVTDPNNPLPRTSPSGFHYDPQTDTFERPPVCDENDDPDGDNVVNEIDSALVDHLEFYLLNYFKPAQWKVTARSKAGRKLMEDIGCTGCHIPNLTIDSDRRIADVETIYDRKNGRFNRLFATARTQFADPVNDGDPYPQLLPSNQSFTVENFYSDLKRHDLGPAFHEREFDDDITSGANRVTEFVTEPLWGVGSTSPYGHDGRSINLDSVIRRHGGEAQAVTNAYNALSANDQNKIQEFLRTLVLFPPDDTASNLNPGDGIDIQTSAGHGSISLPALFQIPELGEE